MTTTTPEPPVPAPSSTGEPAPDFGGQVIDLGLVNDAGLQALRVAVLAELEARATVQQSEQIAAAVAERFLTVRDRGRGVVGGDPTAPVDTFPAWVQPTGAHDAYPPGYRVAHAGKLWVSLLSGNVWEPGTSGWREFFEVVPGEPEVHPEWVQPTGAHDAYRRGEKVTFEGQSWESLIDGNVWSPTAYPDGWLLLEDAAPVEPDPVDPDPDPDPEVPDYPEWVQPTGEADAYNVPDRVMFEGKGYESLIDGNMDSPGAAPDDWMMLEPWSLEEPAPDPEPEPDPEPAPSYPEWKQPTGGHDAYNIGDRVTFQGQVYESKINGNTWSPTGYPAGWQIITA